MPRKSRAPLPRFAGFQGDRPDLVHASAQSKRRPFPALAFYRIVRPQFAALVLTQSTTKIEAAYRRGSGSAALLIGPFLARLPSSGGHPCGQFFSSARASLLASLCDC